MRITICTFIISVAIISCGKPKVPKAKYKMLSYPVSSQKSKGKYLSFTKTQERFGKVDYKKSVELENKWHAIQKGKYFSLPAIVKTKKKETTYLKLKDKEFTSELVLNGSGRIAIIASEKKLNKKLERSLNIYLFKGTLFIKRNKPKYKINIVTPYFVFDLADSSKCKVYSRQFKKTYIKCNKSLNGFKLQSGKFYKNGLRIEKNALVQIQKPFDRLMRKIHKAKVPLKLNQYQYLLTSELIYGVHPIYYKLNYIFKDKQSLHKELGKVFKKRKKKKSRKK